MSTHGTLPSSRWILDFETQVVRGKHVLLYGNIHDQFLAAGQYMRARELLESWFLDHGFDVVLRYDPIDGMVFATPEMSGRFEALCRQGLAPEDPAAPGGATPSPPQPGLAPPPRGRPQAPRPRGGANLPQDEVLARVRMALSQPEVAVAAVLDLADMLTGAPDHLDSAERDLLMRLKKCSLDAAMIQSGAAAGYRNTLVLTATELGRVPTWFHRDNPFLALVQATRPGKEERRQFAVSFLRPGTGRGFRGGERIPLAAVPSLADTFADLTDGLQAWDLEALRRTSHAQDLDVSQEGGLRQLVDFFKLGIRDDPWRQLDRQRVAEAGPRLSRRVIGQPAAVGAVTSMLVSARVGVSMTPAGGGKPKGTFFLVGPTGVGKTELAKALTELVFGDERAFARFDMSEYREEHAAEKLAGAPPGFVGYEEGGQLTNRVIERPYSILLFDEIEKAHGRVLDKFLQILEDGRLTDGKGQTAWFNQSAIVFTSNIGASSLLQAVGTASLATFPYERVAEHFRDAVRHHFTVELKRAEILNRLGDTIVPFDLLRPDFVPPIARKFLERLSTSASEVLGVTLEPTPSVTERITDRMVEGQNLLFGGRQVGTLVETLVRDPLNRWLFEQGDPADLRGSTLRLSLATGALEVTRV